MREAWLGQNNIRLLYFRYKDTPYFTFGLIGIIVLTSIILIFQVIIPQLENWFSIQREVEETNARIAVLEQNINFMNNLDKSQLNSQLQVASTALPADKEFGGILNALSYAALQAGISLDDFAFQVGSVASESAQAGQAGPKTGDELSSVKLNVSVLGSIVGVKNFLREIGQKLPLAEVTNLEGDGKSTSVNLQFYQKPFPLIVLKDDRPIAPISDADIKLLRDLASWQTPVTLQQILTLDASSAAVPLF